METEKRIIKYDNNPYAEIYHKKGDEDYYHRENGPACIGYNKDGSIECEIYWINNKRHREDGPAYIEYNKDVSIEFEEYYINGKKLSKEEWYEKYGWKLQLKDTPMGDIFGVKNE